MPKYICLCEEVTLEEIKRVVEEEGIRDLETLKRRLRVGMGNCGGRYCLNLLLRLYPSVFSESQRWRSEDELHVPPARPPTKPTQLREFMGVGEE